MKRFVLLLLLLFPFSLVLAEEVSSDKIIIENARIDFIQYNNTSFNVKEEYDTTQIFGINTVGNFFEKTFYSVYTNQYLNNKKFEYSYRYGKMTDNMTNNFFSENGNDVLRLGSESEVMEERKKIIVTYDVDSKDSIDKNIYFVVGNNEYTTKKISFSMYILGGFDKKIVLFSLDGEEYSKSIEGLKISYVGGEIMEASYSNRLSPNTGIHVLITEESEIPVKKASEGSFDIMIPIYIALGVLSISFVMVILSKKKKVTK